MGNTSSNTPVPIDVSAANPFGADLTHQVRLAIQTSHLFTTSNTVIPSPYGQVTYHDDRCLVSFYSDSYTSVPDDSQTVNGCLFNTEYVANVEEVFTNYNLFNELDNCLNTDGGVDIVLAGCKYIPFYIVVVSRDHVCVRSCGACVLATLNTPTVLSLSQFKPLPLDGTA